MASEPNLAGQLFCMANKLRTFFQPLQKHKHQSKEDYFVTCDSHIKLKFLE